MTMSDATFIDKLARLVVVAVDDDQLGRHTLQWYHDNIHLPDTVVHVCYVPDFRNKVTPEMSPQAVLALMQGTNDFTDNLKEIYEKLIQEMEMEGIFVRVGGNNPWCALVEYCRKQKATLLVLTSKLNPGNIPREPQVSDKLVLGTMTTDLLVHCPIPVLVARPQ